MKEIVAVAVFILIGIAGYLRMFIGSRSKTSKQKFVEKAEANHWITTGVLTKKRHHVHAKGDDTCGVIYEYRVGDKTYKKKYTLTYYGMTCDCPDEIEVYYNPRRPSKSVTNYDLESSDTLRRGFGCFLSFVLAVVVCKLIIWLF